MCYDIKAKLNYGFLMSTIRNFVFKLFFGFKKQRYSYSFLSTVANTFGGYVLVGVEDNGEITGCNNYDIQNIIESIYDRTVHKLFTDIEEVEVIGKKVLVIKVHKSNHLISTSAGEVFKRLGKNSKPLYPDEYNLNEVTKTTKDFSTLVLAETSESNINSLEVYKLKERLKSRDPESTLINLNDKAFLNDLGLTVSVDIIFRDMLALGKHMPVYTVYSDAVILTLRNILENKEFVKFILEEQEIKQKLFNTVEVMILHYLKENKSIKIEQAAKLVQLEELDTRNILNELVEGGYLERNNRKFIFTQRVYGAFGEDVGYIKDKTVDYIRAKRMIIEYIEKEGFIANRIVQELCMYEDSQSQYTLKKMVEDHLIKLTGKGRGSKYIKMEN